MRQRSLLIVGITLGLQLHSALAQSQYTLKDLEALEREKNYEEFLKHAMDIRPSERQKLWKDMFQSMALEMIDSKIRNREYSLKSFRQVEEIGRRSLLVNDEFFQAKRALFVRHFLNECYQQSSSATNTSTEYTFKKCDGELNSYWVNSKKDPDVALDLASIIEKYPSSVESWPFYKRALSDLKVVPIYCEKGPVQKAIIKKMTQETFHPDFNGDYKALTERVAPEVCFNKLVPALKEMTTSVLTNGLEKEMAMNILEAKGKMTSEEMDFLAIIYLLDGPVVGNKMNIAWGRVEKLSENFKKRQELLEKVKTLPLIPDKIFKDPELPRHKAIINLFARHFPEYLDYYGHKCIDLMDSRKEMPSNVASGFQCSQFLKTAQESHKSGQQWISDAVSTRYSALKKGK